MADVGVPARRDFSREIVQAEVERISAAPDFARAPVMRRLLDFLVRETMEGRGDQLKAYAVAVDGLGRAADFDAQADSYPRVQVGRLRRMLDVFYAREGASGGVRLAIPSGRYRVTFGAEEMVLAAVGDASGRTIPWLALLTLALAVAAMAVLLIFALPPLRDRWATATPATPATNQLVRAPVLEIGTMGDPRRTAVMDREIDAILLDGVRRSWLTRVRDQRAARAGTPDYRLGGEITDEGLLRLRLFDGANGDLIWTGQAMLSEGRLGLRDAVAPLIAELIQPYGVIATHQRAALNARGLRTAPGYPCMLRFDRYRRTRTAEGFGRVRACVARTLAIDERNAHALAASSFLALDEELYDFVPSVRDARSRALTIARRAAGIDPYSPTAQLALARASLFNGSCAGTVRAGHRALALNPYDPDLHAVAGVLLFACGDPATESVVRRALALDPNPPPSFSTPLVYLALDRGDVAAARREAENLMPAPQMAPAFFDLTFAIAAAADGDAAAARQAWARATAADPKIASDPSALLRRWMLPERLIAKSMAYLAGAQIVPAAPPAARTR